MREEIPEAFILLENFPCAEVYYHGEAALMLVLTKTNYIPMEAFKEVFLKVSALIEQHKTESILFDKRSLTIFHQPSMEWYYLSWKSELLKKHQINTHAKILPKDDLFRQSVKQAREKIFQNSSNSNLLDLKIAYFEKYASALAFFNKKTYSGN